MRSALTAVFSAVLIAVCVPLVGDAQGSTATVAGQIVSASGVGQSGLTVDLVSEGMVVSSTVTIGDGHFRFLGLPAGNYVVRTTMNGQPIGVKVSATAGATAPALIVLPSVAKASPGVIVAAIAPALASIAATTASVIANTVAINQAENGDVTFVAQSQQAATQFLNEIAVQIGLIPPPTPGAPPVPNPLVGFIPVTVASGTT
jgi:hypothetical protein